MKKVSLVVALFSLAQAVVWAQPAISSVLNAASYDAAISPGCWVAIMGSGLANTTLAADPYGPALLISLGGVSVTVNGIPAELLYVSPKQINLVIPLDVVIPRNTVVPLTVTSGGTTGRPYNIRLLRHAPAIFTRDGSGAGLALLFDADPGSADTEPHGNTLSFLATGLGPTAGKSERVVDDFEVYYGDRRAEVLFAGRAGALTGLYRIVVSAPVPATDRLYLRAGGWQSNITEIVIRGGTNISNVTGSIDGLYPSGDASSGTSFALMLHAGTFSTSFDIAPAAGPFDIAAVGEGGGAIISVDPSAKCVNDLGATLRGTYSASISTITNSAARHDFSGSIVPLWDYSTCDPASWICLGFPLSIIPLGRSGKLWTDTTQALPAPNVITSPGANAFGQISGCLTDLVTAPNGSHLVINSQNNKIFSIFGGFQQLAVGPSSTRVSSFKLYIDGVRIASKDIKYTVGSRP